MLDLNTLLYTGGTGLILALVQVCKRWVTDDSLYPVLAMGFGIIINIVIAIRTGLDLVTAVFMGIIAGLIACGIYSISGTTGTTSGGVSY